ncbi:MAG: hypothetical protein H6Q70_2398 [Firmicutes bacterium]|nr:hypothetical protein [Bacillota bacterium]
MAIVHKGKRTLNGQANQYLLTSGACVAMLIAYAVMMVQGQGDVKVNVVFMALPVFWIFGAIFYFRKYKIFKAGATGESGLLEYVRKLPNQYHVFTNFQIKEKRIYDEVDLLVIGDTGVFVIEAKNHVGKIVGTADDVEWKQYKTDPEGNTKTKLMANPIKQADWHTINIDRLLRQDGFHVTVIGLLVFTNPKAILEIGSSKLAILDSSKAVNQYILNYKPQQKLNKSHINQIVRALETKVNKK